MATLAVRYKSSESPSLPDSVSAFDRFRDEHYFPALDGVRAWSIIAVIALHSADYPGFLGVDAFFILSGFLITTLLIREQDRTGTISLKRFYWRRTIRIFPPYYAWIAALSVWFAFRGGEPARHFFGTVPQALTYTSNFFPPGGMLDVTWSLAAEEQFYLCWPFLLQKMRRPYAVLLIFGALLFNELVRFQVIPVALPSTNMLQCTFAPLLLGVLLSFALHHRPVFRRLAPIVESRWILAIVGFAFVYFAFHTPLDATRRLGCQIGFSLLLGHLLVKPQGFFCRSLQWAPLRRIGVVSYGMYLFHGVAISFLGIGFGRAGWPRETLLFVAASVFLSYLIAEASFRTLEAAARRFRDVPWAK